MKRVYVLILMLAMISCKSSTKVSRKANTKVDSYKFDYFSYSDTITINVIKYYKGSHAALGRAYSYSLLIGKTLKKIASNDTISVLAFPTDLTLLPGEVVKILPSESPTKNSSLGLIYLVNDTIIKNGSPLLIGSEYPAIWGNMIK